MIDELEQILDSLRNDLDTIENSETDILKRSKTATYRIRESCKQLSLWKNSNELKTIEEEIYYFKEIKVQLNGLLFYHTDIFNFESQRPAGDDSIKRRYIREHLYKLNEHSISHKGLYQYYRTNLSDWDNRYFSKIKWYENKYDSNGFIIQCEDDNSSSHDVLFAKIVSNDKLEKYLQAELLKVLSKPIEASPIVSIGKNGKSDNHQLLWTDSKFALIELVYALHAAGSFGHGTTGIKEITDFVEKSLQIDLGDFYRGYSDLKQRSSRTKYLDKLKAALLAKMDEDDEHR